MSQDGSSSHSSSSLRRNLNNAMGNTDNYFNSVGLFGSMVGDGINGPGFNLKAYN